MKSLSLILLMLLNLSCGDLGEMKKARSVAEIVPQKEADQEVFTFQLSRLQNMTIIHPTGIESPMAQVLSRKRIVFLLTDVTCEACLDKIYPKVRSQLSSSATCQVVELVERPLWRDRPMNRPNTFAINTLVETFSKRFGVGEEARYFVLDASGEVQKEGSRADDDVHMLEKLCL